MKSDREQYAEEEARQFVQTMRKAAFTNKEILDAVNNVLEEKQERRNNDRAKSSHLFTYVQERSVIHVVVAEGYRLSRDDNGTATAIVQFYYDGKLQERRETYSHIPARFDAPLYCIGDNEYLKIVFPWHPDFWEAKAVLGRTLVEVK